MTNKPMTDKARARMYFKRAKTGMTLLPEEWTLVKRFYPFMRNGTEVR